MVSTDKQTNQRSSDKRPATAKNNAPAQFVAREVIKATLAAHIRRLYAQCMNPNDSMCCTGTYGFGATEMCRVEPTYFVVK